LRGGERGLEGGRRRGRGFEGGRRRSFEGGRRRGLEGGRRRSLEAGRRRGFEGGRRRSLEAGRRRRRLRDDGLRRGLGGTYGELPRRLEARRFWLSLLASRSERKEDGGDEEDDGSETDNDRRVRHIGPSIPFCAREGG